MCLILLRDRGVAFLTAGKEHFDNFGHPKIYTKGWDYQSRSTALGITKGESLPRGAIGTVVRHRQTTNNHAWWCRFRSG